MACLRHDPLGEDSKGFVSLDLQVWKLQAFVECDGIRDSSLVLCMFIFSPHEIENPRIFDEEVETCTQGYCGGIAASQAAQHISTTERLTP